MTQKGRALLFLLLIPGCGTAMAQRDSATERHNLHVIFNFDARYSFITGQSVHIEGAKLGLEWNRQWRAGLGGYFLSSQLHRQVRTDRNSPELQDALMRFNYFALFGEYVLYQSRKWEFSLPLQFGIGNLHYDILNGQGAAVQPRRHRQLYLLEPSINGHYKIYNWIGIGAGAGYRQMLTENTRLEHEFDSPVYYLKVKIFLGDLYRDVKRLKVKN